ncbi:YdeI/OmpD-associated family protein [Saccharibacillus kuerlensis]|uniref:YdhG-like domain-containing protein n=1 Tax=Saccharibacillus kuerlensis TaxID=459527 RepID=A0ABQ2L6C0_9BACL|nr:YdeI/OmpD-associated family protein [Saccharibacillus kuerlensis]GGO03508.1 hypothetical protein GCM10010969_27840 [Saccharibacillus kuerlensis]
MTQPRNPKVDAFLEREERWREEFVKLRSLALNTEMTEELKWGQPCYTINGGNVLLIHGFKEYCAILFIKGALLQDNERMLIQQTQKVQAGRQLRFENVREIEDRQGEIEAYMREAIEIEKAGLKVELKSSEEFAVPEELETRFASDAALKEAFEGLTPGRQRAYLLHFLEPKQSKTRVARIDKHAPRIMEGKGLNDR